MYNNVPYRDAREVIPFTAYEYEENFVDLKGMTMQDWVIVLVLVAVLFAAVFWRRR
jgi:hypothetical protein